MVRDFVVAIHIATHHLVLTSTVKMPVAGLAVLVVPLLLVFAEN